MKKIVFIFSIQLWLSPFLSAHLLTKVEAISESKKTFITRNGKAQGFYQGSVVSFLAKDLSFNARSILSTREYSQWLVLKNDLQVPLKPEMELIIDKGKQATQLPPRRFDVEEELSDQKNLYALNTTIHLRDKQRQLARVNDLMTQINELEREHFDPQRPGHPYQVLGAKKSRPAKPQQDQEELLIVDQETESAKDEQVLASNLEAIEQELKAKGYARGDITEEVKKPKLTWTPTGKHFVVLKYGTLQSESISVSGVPDSNFTSRGNMVEIEYQYMIRGQVSLSMGLRQEVELISSPSLDLTTNRAMGLIGVNYHQGIGSDTNLFAGIYVGAGTSTTKTIVSEQSGSYYLLPGVRTGLAYHLTNTLALHLEGAMESLRIVETLPDAGDGNQSTNQVNFRASLGLQLNF